jgi:deoxyribonuclease-4
VCVDTCHVYSAGYDLVNDYDGVMARLEDTLGLGRLRVMHLNDSKTAVRVPARPARADRGGFAGGEAPFRAGS